MRALQLLLVDDDPLDCQAIEQALRGAPLQVVLTHEADPAVALDRMLQRSFDCVLLELHLPRLDGTAVLQNMRSLDIAAPAVMLVGAGDEPRVVELMQAGAADCVVKPALTPLRLAQAVLAAAQLKQARDAAREAGEASRQQVELAQMLMGIVSHDLRNPLNVVMLNAALLERMPDLPGPARQNLDRIRRSGKRAMQLINDLLDFTQVRLGRGIRVTPVPADVHQIAQQMADEVRQSHPGSDIRVACSGEGSGIWDPGRVAQVVCNLLLNAVTHGAPGTPVELEVRGEAEQVCLAVHNQGDPIAAGLMDGLFEPLRQVGTPAVPDHIGLGLFIVKQIAMAHRGEVQVASCPRQGTTFTVRLPRV